MTSNIAVFKTDLARLIETGTSLLHALQHESIPEAFRKKLVETYPNKDEAEAFLRELPSFRSAYQSWYSESLALIKLLLPDRLSDFRRLYEKPKVRKVIQYGNYVIEDCLQGLVVTAGYQKRPVGPDAAIPQFEQQLRILQSVHRRFETSLFDVRQLLQADLFDSELEAAQELLKNRFLRAAGAVAGVVLEKHLRQVCDNHTLTVNRKNPTIGDLNDLLHKNEVIQVPQWRSIQHLADLRNLCDHNKQQEPTRDQVNDLIAGVDKIAKSIF